jgi:hypothetical protein
MNCRSCNAEIFWVKNAKSGKAMPLDLKPNPNGSIRVTGEPPNQIGHYMKLEEIQQANLDAFKMRAVLLLYTPHFATCPDSNKWRKK